MFERGRLGIVFVGAVLLALAMVPATAAADGSGGAGTGQQHALGVTSESGQSERAVTVAKSLSAANGKTVLSGKVEYRGTDGNRHPARQVRIKVRHDVVGPVNPVIARTTTDDQGRYSVKIDVGKYESPVDMESLTKPDKTLHLHVQAVAKNPAVNVVNFVQNLKTANGNTWTISTEATLERGQASETVDLAATGDKQLRRAFQVANWTLEAYRFTEREAGWTRNRVKARYPAANPNNSQFKSPFEKFVIGSNDWGGHKRRTVHHEYGHAVMSGLFNYKGWQIPKPANWGPHCVWSDTGRITAWYEGFAEFFQAAVAGTPRTDGMYLEDHHYYNETNDHGSQCPESHANDGYDGAKVEGAVANVLWDAYDPADEPHDEIDGDLKTVFDAIDEKDNKKRPQRPFNSDRTTDVHDFFIQYVENTGRHEDLRKLYFEYGIVKPDRFDSAGSNGGSGLLNGCSVHYYPCSKQPNRDWTTLKPTESVDVMLHGEETDEYLVPLSKGDRITVTTTAHGGNTTAAFDVVKGTQSGNGQSPRQVASSTRTGNVQELTFTASESGRYRIPVEPAHSDPKRLTSYTISVTHASGSGGDRATGSDDGDNSTGVVGGDDPILGPDDIRTVDPCPSTPGECEIPKVRIPDGENGSNGSSGDGTEDSAGSSDGASGTRSSDGSSSTDTGQSGPGNTDSDAAETGGQSSTSDSSTTADSSVETSEGERAADDPGEQSDPQGTATNGTATNGTADDTAASGPGFDVSVATLALLLALAALVVAVARR